jgi:glycine cleavage system transcriptional repressor
MQNYLVISVVGSNQPGLVDTCATAIKDAGCNIVDCRMTVLGTQCAMLILVTGTWNAIVKVEDTLPKLSARWDLQIVTKRTEIRDHTNDLMPYAVEVVSADRPGIVSDIAHFFTVRNISIEDMYTSTYSAMHTGTPMFSLHMTVSVPTTSSIAALRGEFIEFCDQLNLDSIMEPAK